MPDNPIINPDTPVVFLHAFPLESSLWRSEILRLGARKVLAPNFPGFGGRPPGPDTLEGFASLIVGEMDAAGIHRAVIVGLSMGGYVAFRIASGWPERIAGLVLADTRAGADDEAGAQKRADQAERARREGIEWLADAMLPNLLGETSRRERPAVVEAVRGMIQRADPEGVARALLAMRTRPDSRNFLEKIEVPVLAIAGTEDTITPVAEARAIAEGVPNGSLVEIPRAGHLSNLENPEAFWGAVAPFLGA